MDTKKVKDIKVLGKPAQQETNVESLNDQQINEQKQNKKSIAICVPAYGTVSVQWLIHFWRFMLHNFKKYVIHIFIHEQQPTSTARNSLARMALDKDPDYIFWLDSDNIAPDGTIERLINTMEDTKAELVTALYFGKDAPHYPVIRQYRSEGFYKEENPALGQRFQIAGCGFGCCLIRPSVFYKLEEPWFKFSHEKWGKDNIVLSEDLYFSRKMMKAGMKLICDTGVVSGHVGSMVDVMEYMNYAPIRESTMLEREELLKDVVEFTGRTQYDVDMDTMVGQKLVTEEWNEKLPSSDEEIKSFYRETKNYLYESTNWHFGTRRRFDIELVTACLRLKDKKVFGPDKEKPKVLEFGCGISQNAIMLARAGFDVTIADLDGYTLKFAEHRFKKHKIPYKVWKTDVEEMPPEEKYDIILAFEVFEHMVPDDMVKVTDKLVKLRHKKTEVITTQNFGRSKYYPMHMDMEEKHKEALQKLLKNENDK